MLIEDVQVEKNEDFQIDGETVFKRKCITHLDVWYGFLILHKKLRFGTTIFNTDDDVEDVNHDGQVFENELSDVLKDFLCDEEEPENIDILIQEFEKGLELLKEVKVKLLNEGVK